MILAASLFLSAVSRFSSRAFFDLFSTLFPLYHHLPIIIATIYQQLHGPFDQVSPFLSRSSRRHKGSRSHSSTHNTTTTKQRTLEFIAISIRQCTNLPLRCCTPETTYAFSKRMLWGERKRDRRNQPASYPTRRRIQCNLTAELRRRGRRCKW